MGMDEAKLAAAKEALRHVKEGMAVGLGSGSTAEIFIGLLGKKNAEEKLGLRCIATSLATERCARKAGLKLCSFSEIGRIDIAFDGADQVDPKLRLIKGMGGALVREKIVDYRAEKFFVLVGENKLVRRLSGIVPVEVIPFSAKPVADDLLLLGAKKVEARGSKKGPFKSDNGNFILHADFGAIADPQRLEKKINGIAGVVDNGIFSSKKPKVIVGTESKKAYVLG